MSDWTNGYNLTAAGRRLQAKVEAGTALQLTRMKLGSGTETADEVDDLVDLVNSKVEIPISSAAVKGETCTITGNLLVDRVTEGFWCREWGVYALDPDEGEILYLITLTDKPDWIPAGAAVGTAVTYVMNVAVANATTVIAQIDLTGLVDTETLHQYTHTCSRQSSYQKGETLNEPSLPNGLVLESTTDGSTGAALVDYSQAKVGDTIVDGEVTWKVKKVVTTSVDDNEHTIEWLHDAIAGIGAIHQELIIPVTGWEESGGQYKYSLAIVNDNVRKNTPTQLIIHPESQETAGLCGLASVISLADKSITLYAKAKPQEPITAQLMVFVTKGGGGGGGDVDLPIATESTLGAVKIGGDLNIEADGTLSVDRDTVMDDTDLANEEEVMEDVRRILHDE
jgi:hypothetical protein